MEDGKKISFGFSKLFKKTAIVPSQLNKVKVEDSKVEFIDCLEGKSIKLKDPVQTENKILVIPVKNVSSSTSKNGLPQTNLTDQPTNTGPNSSTKESSNGSFKNENDSLLNVENKKLTLDQIAAKEILEEINKKKDNEESRIYSVPLTSSAPEGEKESTIDDYENVPVNQFGLAMLRGMGWAPGKGIGKNEKLVTPSLPTLRPKGMGLGADKFVKPQIENPTSGDVLKMSKGSYIRVTAGTHKDNYGQIEGFDEESGRVIVKLALQNIPVSLNEFMIQVVEKTDFTKNSKVINVAKYEQYKNEEVKSSVSKDKAVTSSSASNKKEDKNRSHYDTSDSETSSKNNKFEKRKKEKFSPPRKSRDKYSERKSRSRTRSPEEKKINRHSKSPKRKSSNLKTKEFRDYHKEKKQTKSRSKNRYSSTSSLSSSSSDSSSYSRKKKAKEGSRNSYRKSARSRSRSPRKHSKHKRSKHN